MKKRSMNHWLKKAIEAADLMQTYVDLATDQLEDTTKEEKKALREILKEYKPEGPEAAAAVAILKKLLRMK